MKPYWRIKKDGKWTWLPARGIWCPECIAWVPAQEMTDDIEQVPGEV